MNGSFNGQILVDKLAKLNNSQQSIETLSHWCIFHRNKAKQVVETWERQFHCAPRDRRVSFLYLANDILQNSRRKGMEFISEFWRVLPGALNDVLNNGGEFGRNTVKRLVAIWEERKVFGSRGQILKEELLGRNLENRNRDGKGISYKLKQPGGELLENLISSYEHINSVPVDEETLFGKCQVAISFIDKVDKDYGNNLTPGNGNGSIVGELQMHHGILRECIEQLKAAESSRTTLISLLREALHEQELKIEQVRNQLQVAQSRYEQADIICQKLPAYNIAPPPTDHQNFQESSSVLQESAALTGEKPQTTTATYTPEAPLINPSNLSHHPEAAEDRKTAAAAVVAKLAASTSSAQMLSYVLSSLASEGVITQQPKEEHPPDNKRPKLENAVPSYVPSHPQPPLPLPPFQHPDALQPPPQPPQSSPPPVGHSSPIVQQQAPPPPASLPPLQPPPPPPPPLPATSTTQFMQNAAGSMTCVPYGYGSSPPFPLPGYPMVGGMPPFPIPPNMFLTSLYRTVVAVSLASPRPCRRLRLP
uniref:CID domain-containing protein n=1 Tax=Ananas comosus var. bracteatus TaxID=296719 RepID=A0A6V7QV88_ANACO